MTAYTFTHAEPTPVRFAKWTAHHLPAIALLCGLAAVGVWATRISGSAVLGVVAANFAFLLVAAFFPARGADRR